MQVELTGMYDFYPRSPRGERRARLERSATPRVFLSTLPARGATFVVAGAEGDTLGDFYPRSPRGERHVADALAAMLSRFLSTLPARGATVDTMTLSYRTIISIHAPREGSDRRFAVAFVMAVRFLSTLPARGATDFCFVTLIFFEFLSTLPARGATPSSTCSWRSTGYFYPRSPRGERPSSRGWMLTSSTFLSTLPARGATFVLHGVTPSFQFLSTLPARGATTLLWQLQLPPQFLSTLPARGATLRGEGWSCKDRHFYPRSPRGERPGPCGGQHPPVNISIHAPREGSDHVHSWQFLSFANFYPRSPRGERR